MTYAYVRSRRKPPSEFWMGFVSGAALTIFLICLLLSMS